MPKEKSLTLAHRLKPKLGPFSTFVHQKKKKNGDPINMQIQ